MTEVLQRFCSFRFYLSVNNIDIYSVRAKIIMVLDICQYFCQKNIDGIQKKWYAFLQ